MTKISRDAAKVFGEAYGSGKMPKDESIVYEHEKENLKLERHPIILSETTCILITLLRSHNHLSHMFTTDYVDHRKEQKLAARDLIAQISDHCSVNFLWSLKEAIDEEIKSHGSDTHKFPLDRPKDQ